MICATVFYANTPGKKFDHDYYHSKHIPMVKDRLTGSGLLRCEVDRGLSSALPGSPAPYVCICRFYFNTTEEFAKAFQDHMAEFRLDIPNYTDIEPEFQISQTM